MTCKELKPCPFCGGDMWNMLNPFGIMVAIPRVRSALNDFDNPTSIPEDYPYHNWELEIVKPSYNGNRKRYYCVAFIKCKNCGAIVSFDGKESMSQTINAWNRRVNNDKQ